MPIFKYSFLKYAKAKSTLIIFCLSIFLILLLSYLALASNFDASSNYWYASRCAIFLSLILGFISAATCIFAGFIGAALFRDEIEDQSFLIIISKNYTRSKIFMAKLLALFCWEIIYTGIMSLTLIISIFCFDQGRRMSNLNNPTFPVPWLSQLALAIGLIAWAIWLAVCNLFLAFSVLISTKFSSRATICATTGWGVFVPLSSMIGLFLPKVPYTNTLAWHFNSLVKNVDNLNQHFDQEIVAPLDHDDLDGSIDMPTLYNLGISTNQQDYFPKAWFFDLNFQFGILATFALDQVFPLAIQNYIEPKGGYTFLRSQIIENPSFSTRQNLENQVAYFDQLIINSWNTLAPLRAGLIKYFNQILMSFPADFAMPTTPLLNEALANLKISPSDTLNQKSLKQIASYDYQVQTIENQAYYFQMLYAFNRYYGQVKLDFSLEVFKLFEDSRQVLGGMHILDALNIVTLTCNWLDLEVIDQILLDNELSVNYDYVPQNYEQSLPLKLIGDNLDQQHIYQKVRTLLANGIEIRKITTQRYVDPWVIMSAYLIISFLFYLLAYLVMLKQDIK